MKEMHGTYSNSAWHSPQNPALFKEKFFSPSCSILRLYKENDIRVLMHLLRLKEPEAYLHSLRVASLMDEVFQEKDEILRGSLLHDIGKLAVPFGLTLYPHSLTQNEKKIIGMHTLLGAEILEEYSETMINCVKLHHDEDCPFEYIQRLRACDIYDALTNERPYRSACTPNEAADIMEGMKINPDHIAALMAT